MYAYIKGIVAQKYADNVVIETQGVGYCIFVSTRTLSELPAVGETALVHTYLAVREDAFLLYGFGKLEEKTMFERLITVSGIGPKLAMAVLAGMSVSELALAIITNDVRAISRIPGVGKKSAERMILELKSKISQDELPGTESAGASVSISDGARSREAVDALMALGYSGLEASRAVAAAGEEGDVQDIILRALKSLDRR